MVNPFQIFSSLAPVFAGAGAGPQAAVQTAGYQQQMRQQQQQEASQQELGQVLQQAFSSGQDPKRALLQALQERPDLLFQTDFNQLAQGIQFLQGGGQDLGASGQKLMAAGIEPGTPEARAALFPEAQPTLFEKKIKANMEILGMDAQTAYKHAADMIKVAQVTDPFTGESYPILIDETGAGQRLIQNAGGMPTGGGEVISPQAMAELKESGALKPGISIGAAEGATESETEQKLRATEGMTAAQGAALGTGSGASLARGLGSFLTAMFVPGAQDQVLLDSQAAISDVNTLGNAYIRDEAGTARLAGVTELKQMKELLPSTDLWTSPQENITRLTRLRDRIVNDMTTISGRLERPHSPQFAKNAEEVLYTLDRMLERIGPREGLIAARDYIDQHPNSLDRFSKQLHRVFGGGLASAVGEVAGGATAAMQSGMPEEQFQALLKRDLTKENPVSEEELNAMSESQLNALLAEGARQREAATGRR